MQQLSSLVQILHQNHQHLPSYTPIFQLLAAQSATAATAAAAALLRRVTRQLHGRLILLNLHPPTFLLSRIVAAYSSSDDLHSATLVFCHSPQPPHALLHNALIRGHSKFRPPNQTLSLFRNMHSAGVPPDHFTFPFVLKACGGFALPAVGKSVHLQCLVRGLEADFYVGTSLIDLYVKFGEVGNARKVFDFMPVKDAASWNAMIVGYMKAGDVVVAEEMFGRMGERNERNVVTWTAMVSGYSQNGAADRAIATFDEMLSRKTDGIGPNSVTVTSVLPACAQSGSIEYGMKVHDFAKSRGFDTIPSVRIALVGMYAKCGNLASARRCFDEIHVSDKNVVAWNTMLTAYASNGLALDALSVFDDMVKLGFQPDEITFTGLLSGFSHAGLVDLGMKYFHSIKSTYSVEPRSEHYACVVDLLGRAGRLVEAKALIDDMAVEPGPSVWGALLAASRTYRNLDIAEIAAKRLFVLEPENSGNYVLLSNMYAEAGRWNLVDQLRAALKGKGVRKNPGCSWIELNGKAHAFYGGDGNSSHPQSVEIFKLLEDVTKKIRAAGYVPDTSVVLHDVTEEEKEWNLMAHSEKQAVAFGLRNAKPGTVLRVTKNLRTCRDCHTTIKFVSKLYSRRIVVRDVNRFHHFEDGSCSCGDYW